MRALDVLNWVYSAILTGVNIALCIRIKRTMREPTPYALFRIHVRELAAQRNPDGSVFELPLYIAAPPVQAQLSKSPWIYVGLHMTGFDIWRIRNLLAMMPPDQEWLYVRCYQGMPVRALIGDSVSILHFAYEPVLGQT